MEITVAEAIECYYNLVKYNKINGFCEAHPSCVFAEKLRAFLADEGVLV